MLKDRRQIEIFYVGTLKIEFIYTGSGWCVQWEWLVCAVGVAGVCSGSGWCVQWEWLVCAVGVAGV